RAAAISIGDTGRLEDKAAAARRRASPSSFGTAAATACISSSWPLQWSTTSQPAAIAARARSPTLPLSASIEISSVISRPSKPLGDRRRDRGDLLEAAAIGAIADDTVGPRHRHIRHRKAVDRNAECAQVRGDQAGAEPCGADAQLGLVVVEAAVGGAGRVFGP